MESSTFACLQCGFKSGFGVATFTLQTMIICFKHGWGNVFVCNVQMGGGMGLNRGEHEGTERQNRWESGHKSKMGGGLAVHFRLA